ncbi:protein unc-93 homolog A isoform X3 [Nycticebus coucang]|uniref:protein unc-93 homolog A isoform X3 n=1 Tax=Nycticebus coucang TaxID=9470 RepID=UPI00234DCAF3|nr:protein unc-93 homolog A isoform X3 [Nycticebus coucang]
MVDTSEQRNAQETEERPCGLFWVFAALHGLWRAAESPEQPVQRGGPGRVGAEHPVRRRAAVLHAPAASAHPQPGLQVDHRGLHVWLCRLLHRKLLRQLVHSDPHLHPAGAGGRPAVVHTVHLPDHHGERECQEGGEARQGRGEPVLRHLLPHLPVVRRVGQLDLLSGLRPDAQQRVHFGGAAHILRGQRLPHGHQAQQQHPAALPGAGLHPAGHLHRPWNVFEEQRSVRVSSGERSPHPAGDQKSKGSGILAILLIAVFLEPIQDDRRDCAEEKQPPFWSTLLSTFRLFKDRRLRLLVLLPLYSGLQQGFLSVLRHLCPGHPVRGLRDDLLLSHRLAVLPAVRETLPVHGQDCPLPAGCRHPDVLCHRPPAVEASPGPSGCVLRVPRPVGCGRRRLADAEQCSVWRTL